MQLLRRLCGLGIVAAMSGSPGCRTGGTAQQPTPKREPTAKTPTKAPAETPARSWQWITDGTQAEAAADAVRLADGTIISASTLTDLRTGRSFPVPVAASVDIDCRATHAGARLFAVCDQAYGKAAGVPEGLTVYEFDKGQWRPHFFRKLGWRLAELREAQWAIGSNGSVVLGIACGEDDDGDLCWFNGAEGKTVAFRDVAPQLRMHGEPISILDVKLLDAYENWALVLFRPMNEDQYWVVDLRGVREPELLDTPRGPVFLSLQFVDGTLSWFASQENKWVFRRWRDGVVETFPAKIFGQRTDFASPTHGVALSGNLRELWTTDDGGRTWQPAPAGPEPADRFGTPLCSNVACRALPVAWVDASLFELIGERSVR